MEGGRNFRDLGGYATADARQVRWGRLYRSGVMSYLTQADCARLDALQIRAVCDLRTQVERDREPTRWVGPGIDHLYWDYDRRHVRLRQYMNSAAELTSQSVREAMSQLYRSFPNTLAEQFSSLMQRIAAGALPLVFHCSAGKDRTGIAAALILSCLGVPRKRIIEDYLLSNTAVDLERELFTHRNGGIGVGDEYSYLCTVESGVRAPLLQALPEYLQSAFAQIEQEHGSVTGYLTTRLGLKPHVLRRVQAELLEPMTIGTESRCDD